MSRQRWMEFAVALAVGVFLCVLRVEGNRAIDFIDLRALDYRFWQRGPRPVTPEVVIVAIDDASIAAVGRWPWSRTTMGDLIRRISDAGAAVIGVDVVQSERGTPEDDAKLVEAVRDSQRAVLGYFFDATRTEPGAYAGEAVYPSVQRAPGGDGGLVPRASAATQNLPEVAAGAAGLGYFNFIPDDDGLYRRVPLAFQFGDRIALPLSLAMLQRYWPDRRPAIRLGPTGVESVRLGAQALPVEEDGQLLLNYRGPRYSFRYVSAADVLADRVPPDAFRDELVLLGVTAVGVADIRAVPNDPRYPGVEIHATALDNILRGDFVARPAWIGSARLGLADVSVILGIVLVLAALLRLRGLYGALAAAGLLAAYLVGSQWLFVHRGVVLSVAYPMLAVALTYIGISVQHYVSVDREKRQTRRTLELYLSPALARYVSERPEMLALGGEKSERTVLFSDVRSFTSIAEKLPPEQLVELLNVYLGEMTDAVFAEDGMLDKYIGDGVMAVWGAPIPQPDHAARACRAALAMVERLAELNRHVASRGWPTLGMRIGLNSGPMVFGNMGSKGHLSLTVMGDNVNLGARLEGINKLYGTTIIASEATVREAGEVIVTRELDLVRVKGKSEAARIFHVLGPGDSAARWAELIEHFHAGLAAYRARDWTAAIAAFERAIRVRPEDGPSDLYLRRCRQHLHSEPPPDWEAVTTFADA